MGGFEGAARLHAALLASPRVALEVLGGALYGEGNETINEAKVLTPVDKGTLKASGHVELPEVRGTFVEVVLGFGGAARSYAVIQHEREDFQHTVGQAHFLSEPMARRAVGVEQRLAATVAAVPLFPGLV